MRSIITLGAVVVVIAAGFAFIIFNPSAQKASQQNIESSAQDIVDQTKKTQ